MKVVINKCFGGFSLSPLATKRLAERQGRECYFFVTPIVKGKFGARRPVSMADADGTFMWTAYDIPNPNEVLGSPDNWHDMTMEQRAASNELHDKHTLESRPADRADADLVAVVEELGAAANGKHASLSVVEIPDGTEYTIEEYDGREHVAEVHKTWS